MLLVTMNFTNAQSKSQIKQLKTSLSKRNTDKKSSKIWKILYLRMRSKFLSKSARKKLIVSKFPLPYREITLIIIRLNILQLVKEDTLLLSIGTVNVSLGEITATDNLVFRN
jgi:hypothetical protein